MKKKCLRNSEHFITAWKSVGISKMAICSCGWNDPAKGYTSFAFKDYASAAHFWDVQHKKKLSLTSK